MRVVLLLFTLLVCVACPALAANSPEKKTPAVLILGDTHGVRLSADELQRRVRELVLESKSPEELAKELQQLEAYTSDFDVRIEKLREFIQSSEGKPLQFHEPDASSLVVHSFHEGSRTLVELLPELKESHPQAAALLGALFMQLQNPSQEGFCSLALSLVNHGSEKPSETPLDLQISSDSSKKLN